MLPPDLLLTDAQMGDFVRSGFLVAQPAPDEPHAQIGKAILRLLAERGNPDNAIYNEIPGLLEIFATDAVRGVLTSLLGAEYRLQCHRHTHVVPVTDSGTPQTDPKYHQDGTDRQFKGWNRPWRRWHRPRRLNVFYYPDDVTSQSGPTEVVSGSQYWTAFPDRAHTHADALAVPAGSLAFTHYNLWHRGTINHGDRPRVMVKFVVERCAEPVAPNWNADHGYANGNRLEPPGDSLLHPGPHTTTAVFNWMSGGTANGCSPSSEPRALWELASDTDESPETVEAAYELALHGQDAVRLVAAPFAEADSVTRERAALVLSAVGGDAMTLLIESLAADDEWVRATALDLLADIGNEGLKAGDAIRPLIDDPSPWVRHNLMQALEVWGPLAAHLRDLALRGLDDDNPHVCFNAMSALVNTGVDAGLLDQKLRPLQSHQHHQVAWKAADLLSPHSNLAN